MSDEATPPDLGAIRDAYANLSVVMYACRLDIADVPVEVNRAHGIPGSELVRCGAKAEYPELWECRCVLSQQDRRPAHQEYG